MKDWKCPLEYIDKDIREVVRLLYENDMKPFMSCSGSYEDHQDKKHRGVIVPSADVEILDSEKARELIATLIGDKRFKCSIKRAGVQTFYDNDLPEGIRFGIEFENVLGNNQEELCGIIEDIIAGKRANIADRNKVDLVCDMLNKFDVKHNNRIAFSFNDEEVVPDRADEDNYSIVINDKKDFANFYDESGNELTGFRQDAYGSKLFGDDFLTMMAVLKKLEMDYRKIPVIMHAPKVIRQDERKNKYFFGRDKKIFEIEEQMNSSLNQIHEEEFFDPMDLFAMFPDDDEGEI